MENKIYWKDILNRFLDFLPDELSLPVLIGGDDCLRNFYGFNTVGKKTKKVLTGYDVLDILYDLTKSQLEEEISHKEWINKFGIGISRVHLIHTVWEENPDIDEYEPTQDYLVDEGFDIIPDINQVNIKFKDQKEVFRACKYEPTTHELIKPGKFIIIEILDGSCLLMNKDYFYE